MHTKQKHPLQFCFKFLNNSFPFIYIKPQTNIDFHYIPKPKYAFQGHCTPGWEWSQWGWIPVLYTVHKGTRSKNLSKCLWALDHLYVGHIHSFANDADMWLHVFDSIQTSVLQRRQLKQSTSCSQNISRHLAQDRGFSQSNTLHLI